LDNSEKGCPRIGDSLSDFCSLPFLLTQSGQECPYPVNGRDTSRPVRRQLSKVCIFHYSGSIDRKKEACAIYRLTPTEEGLEYEREVENIPVTNLPIDFERMSLYNPLLQFVVFRPALADQDHEH
jgi:hypothetical protein